MRCVLCGRESEVRESFVESAQGGLECLMMAACSARIKKEESRVGRLPWRSTMRFPPRPEFVTAKDECPECRHSKSRRHLADGRCTVGGCGHDPGHLGQVATKVRRSAAL